MSGCTRVAKIRTTINIDERIVHDVEESGVKNFSAHVERLCKKELKQLEKLGKTESLKVQKWREQLQEIEVVWMDYLERQGAKKKGAVNNGK